MANKSLKTIKFPGLDDTYTIPQTYSDVGAVPTSRTVNGKSLNNNITLSASDVGALPTTTHIPSDQVNSDWNAATGVSSILNKPAIPSNTSDLVNDSGFITSSSIPAAATATPLMDGTGAVGTSSKWAKEDHRHPTDTSRQATLVSGTNIKTVNGTSLLGSGNISTQELPSVTTSDNGKVLMVVSGAWAASSLPIYAGESTFVPAATGESF